MALLQKPSPVSSSRERRAPLVGFAATTGLLGLMLAAPLLEFGLQAASQLSFNRALALFACVSLLLCALGVPGLALVRLLARVPALRALGGAIALALVALQLALVSQRLFTSPLAQLGGLVLAGVLLVAFLLKATSEREVCMRLIGGLGFALIALPLVASPVCLPAALAFQPRLATAPSPPVQAALRPDAPRRIILVTFDALSFEHTALAHGGEALTPELARLMRQSHVFDNCRASANRTLLAVPAILTGVRPSLTARNIRNRSGFAVPGMLTGLAGFLSPAGYQGNYATMLVDPGQFGLREEFRRGSTRNRLFQLNLFQSRHFLALDGALRYLRSRWVAPPPAEHPLTAADEVFSQGLSTLRDEEGPCFLWLHVGLPHAPYYEVPADRRAALANVNGLRRYDEARIESAPASELPRLRRAYDSTVHFADAELGAFVTTLKQDGLWRDTLLVVTSDHGESLTPTIRLHTKKVINEAIAHVPLVIHLPGQRRSVRHSELCSQLDILPSVLAQVYTTPPAGFSGVSLFAQPDPERVVYTWTRTRRFLLDQMDLPGRVLAYYRHYRYTRSWPDGAEQLVDLNRSEDQDIRSARPDLLVKLRDSMRKALASNRP